jgi:hypothetical protein
MNSEYPHLQEVIDRIKRANKETKDNKAYDEAMDKLGVRRFFK